MNILKVLCHHNFKTKVGFLVIEVYRVVIICFCSNNNIFCLYLFYSDILQFYVMNVECETEKIIMALF